MKIETLENYIRYTTIPYGDLLKRAAKGGLTVIFKKDAVVEIIGELNKRAVLYFEDEAVYKENKTCGIIASQFNYRR